MKEHQDACQKGALEKLAFAEHVWESHNPIRWEETTVVDQVRTYKELLLKEVIHIWLLKTPSTGMGYWSCLDVGGLPWRAGKQGNLPLPVTCFDNYR